MKWDTSILRENIFVRNKKKHINKRSLLANFFEVVMDELRKKQLQTARKTQKEKLCQRSEYKHQLKDALPPIH